LELSEYLQAMRLLKYEKVGWFNRTAYKFSLTEFSGDNIPQYAILSHRWGAVGEEITFNDLKSGGSMGKIGYKKLQFCAEQAAHDGLTYFWIDTCCIDKSSSTELSEAINSMFQWYRGATKCYAYLPDVSMNGNNDGQFSQCEWESAFKKSEWFTRGWTLQELVAPSSVEFFSIEGKWLGDKKSLERQIHDITDIAIKALQGNPLTTFSVNERMSWAARRRTTRGEDAAYCLLGIFGIHMPLIYGEGRDNALLRLQEEVNKRLANYQPDKLQVPQTAFKSLQPRPSSTVPFRRDRDFVYRDILSDIYAKCSLPSARVALVGLGGVG
jgi:hypothetical protein